MSDDSFFNRWSRRKIAVKAGEPVPKDAPAAAEESVALETTAHTQDAAAQPEPTAPPAPTLDEAQALAPGSEISRFMQAGVTPDVKNAALKKLFADPHFNVMDRLDTYIDDYSKADPIPLEMLKRMVGPQLLKIFDDEEEKPEDMPGDKPEEPVSTEADAPVAHSSDAQPPSAAPPGASPVAPDAASALNALPEPKTHDDHLPDLQLQRDDAAESAGLGRGAEPIAIEGDSGKAQHPGGHLQDPVPR